MLGVWHAVAKEKKPAHHSSSERFFAVHIFKVTTFNFHIRQCYLFLLQENKKHTIKMIHTKHTVFTCEEENVLTKLLKTSKYESSNRT